MTVAQPPPFPERDSPHDALPEPGARQEQHRRDIAYRGWLREDGLWDLEGQLHDAKALPWLSQGRGLMQAGATIHGMKVRVTVDDGMRVVAAHAVMMHTPFDECQGARPPMQLLVGATVGAGWRRAIDEAMGGVHGCTHLRELIYGIGTLAYQTIAPALAARASAAGVEQTPRHLDQCISWDITGSVVRRHAPRHFKPDRGDT